MAEYRTRKPRTPMVRKTDNMSARVEHDVSELLERAPHLGLLRSAAQSDEGSDAGSRDALLEDFRRIVTEDDGRIAMTPAHSDRADAVRAKLADLGITEADVGEAVSWARERVKRS